MGHASASNEQRETPAELTLTSAMGAPTSSAIGLLEDLIADLEGKLNLAPGADPQLLLKTVKDRPEQKQKQKKKQKQNNANKKAPAAADPNLPHICKLEFKVGVITKVWVHPDASKLYCEEIDCGEEGGPRQIASGLRPHYSEEEMLGKHVLVVANLKVRLVVITICHFELENILCCSLVRLSPS